MPDGSLEILGGEHRWKAAQQLGMAEVPVWNVGVITDEHAKKIGLVDNARYGEDDLLGLAGLLKELGNAEGVHVKAPDEVRPELIRALTEELAAVEPGTLSSRAQRDLARLLEVARGVTSR